MNKTPATPPPSPYPRLDWRGESADADDVRDVVAPIPGCLRSADFDVHPDRLGHGWHRDELPAPMVAACGVDGCQVGPRRVHDMGAMWVAVLSELLLALIISNWPKEAP